MLRSHSTVTCFNCDISKQQHSKPIFISQAAAQTFNVQKRKTKPRRGFSVSFKALWETRRPQTRLWTSTPRTAGLRLNGKEEPLGHFIISLLFWFTHTSKETIVQTISKKHFHLHRCLVFYFFYKRETEPKRTSLCFKNKWNYFLITRIK